MHADNRLVELHFLGSSASASSVDGLGVPFCVCPAERRPGLGSGGPLQPSLLPPPAPAPGAHLESSPGFSVFLPTLRQTQRGPGASDFPSQPVSGLHLEIETGVVTVVNSSRIMER